MDIVLDTNVLLISLPSKSKYRPIFDHLIKGSYNLMVSNEIISEYFEIIERKTNNEIASNVIGLLLGLGNVIKTEIYFRWNLISVDYDDNKFVDCAISAGAKCIVSNDKHFKILKEIDFPKLEVITDDEFLSLIDF